MDPGAPQVALVVKKLPMQDPKETWAQSRAREDPLEAARAWRSPWTEEPGGPQSLGA